MFEGNLAAFSSRLATFDGNLVTFSYHLAEFPYKQTDILAGIAPKRGRAASVRPPASVKGKIRTDLTDLKKLTGFAPMASVRAI